MVGQGVEIRIYQPLVMVWCQFILYNIALHFHHADLIISDPNT